MGVVDAGEATSAKLRARDSGLPVTIGTEHHRELASLTPVQSHFGATPEFLEIRPGSSVFTHTHDILMSGELQQIIHQDVSQL